MKVYYIPEGVENIKTLFPAVNFDAVSQWSLVVKDDQDTILAETRTNKIVPCCDDRLRIHFINACGELDSINFSRAEEVMETKSDTWEKAIKFPLNRSQGGVNRKSITSNEIIEAETTSYSEKDQYWIKELFTTPQAWLEMNLPNGFLDSNEKIYIPIEVYDGKFQIRKAEKRYEYLVKIKVAMANHNINHR